MAWGARVALRRPTRNRLKSVSNIKASLLSSSEINERGRNATPLKRTQPKCHMVELGNYTSEMRTHHDTNMEGWPCRHLYCLRVFLDRFDRKRSIQFRPLRSIFVPIGEHYMSVPSSRFVFSHLSLQMERELLIGSAMSSASSASCRNIVIFVIEP